MHRHLEGKKTTLRLRAHTLLKDMRSLLVRFSAWTFLDWRSIAASADVFLPRVALLLWTSYWVLSCRTFVCDSQRTLGAMENTEVDL